MENSRIRMNLSALGDPPSLSVDEERQCRKRQERAPIRGLRGPLYSPLSGIYVEVSQSFLGRS